MYCLIEILVTGYFEVTIFNEFIDNPPDSLSESSREFITLIKNYVTGFNLTELYKDRFNIIIKTFKKVKDENSYTWSKSVGEYFEKVMFPNMFLWEHHYSENDEVFIKNYSSYQLKLTLEELISPQLNTIIQNKMIPQGACTVHHNCEVVLETKLENILVIDVETNLEDQQSSVDTNHLNTSIQVFSKDFLLIGAVGSSEKLKDHHNRHYIAYTKNLNTNWLVHDDSSDSHRATKLLGEQPKINIALAIY